MDIENLLQQEIQKEQSIQHQIEQLDMTDDEKQQRRLGIQQELFRTELRLSKIRKSLGLGGIQQAGNSFDVTGGSQTQTGLDLGTAVSA